MKEEKLREKFERLPLLKEYDLEDLLKWLSSYGFIIEKDRGKGSHFLATHPKLKDMRPFTIPSKNGKTVMFVYVKELNKFVKELKELQ